MRKGEKHFLFLHSLFDIQIKLNEQIALKEAKNKYS